MNEVPERCPRHETNGSTVDTMRIPLIVGVVAAVVLGATLLPVPGLIVAAAAGVIAAVVAITHSVRDGIITTFAASALTVIAVGASMSILLSIVFLAAVALGVAAARRIGRGLVASAVAAGLAAQVLGPARLSPPESVLALGGVALAGGLIVCAVAVFVVPWKLAHVAPRTPADVARFAVIVVPLTIVLAWVSLVLLPESPAWWAVVALFVALIPSRSGSWKRVAIRAGYAALGAAAGGAIVTVAGGTPVLAAIGAVIVVAYTALAGHSGAFRVALALSIVLLGAAL